MGKSETRIDTGEGGRATQSYGTRDTAFQCDKRGAKRALPKTACGKMTFISARRPHE